MLWCRYLFMLFSFLFTNQWYVPVVFHIYSTHTMWPDLRKRVLHTWMSNSMNFEDNFVIKRHHIWNWNFLQPLNCVGASCWTNFKSTAFTKFKLLQIVEVGNLDVCGRPIFANLVTYRWVTHVDLSVLQQKLIFCLTYTVSYSLTNWAHNG